MRWAHCTYMYCTSWLASCCRTPATLGNCDLPVQHTLHRLSVVYWVSRSRLLTRLTSFGQLQRAQYIASLSIIQTCRIVEYNSRRLLYSSWRNERVTLVLSQYCVHQVASCGIPQHSSGVIEFYSWAPGPGVHFALRWAATLGIWRVCNDARSHLSACLRRKNANSRVPTDIDLLDVIKVFLISYGSGRKYETTPHEPFLVFQKLAFGVDQSCCVPYRASKWK